MSNTPVLWQLPENGSFLFLKSKGQENYSEPKGGDPVNTEDHHPKHEMNIRTGEGRTQLKREGIIN